MPVAKFLHEARTRRTEVVRDLARDSRRSFWALADQGVVSMGNFGVNVLLGREFARLHQVSLYGDFWTLMELMIFLNGLQAALIVYPLSIQGAVSRRRSLGRMTSMSLLCTLIGWPLLAATLAATSFVAKIPLGVGLWAAAALLLWQVQETTRRAMMAHLRFRGALLGDLLSYAGQVAAMAWLAFSGRLNLISAFQAMALTSGVAALVQACQVKIRRVRIDELKIFIGECWKLGRFVLGGNLTNFFVGPLYAWNARFWMGDELLGVNYAVTNLLRLCNPLTSSISSLITPTAAAARQEQGTHRSRKVLLRFGLLGGLLLTPYLALLCLAPKWSLALAYGADSEYLNWSMILRITAVASGLMFVGMSSGAFLNAVQETRRALLGQVVYAAAAVLIAMPLVAKFHLIGAASGWLIAATIQAIVNLYSVARLPDEQAVEIQKVKVTLHRAA